MAHPKRKQSHSRTRKRRNHDKIQMPRMTVCPECKRLKPAQRTCPFCGYYKGREVVRVEKKQKKKKEGR